MNPLPVDLLDGMLIYRNWAYLLRTRFPAGGRIERIDSLRQKNFRWRLSRQTALESSRDTEEWDPSTVELPDRVAEMLMFHNAVGAVDTHDCVMMPCPHWISATHSRTIVAF